ncbi:MAG TPA: chemotaxis-specific protein-glutamate methyltransferase CheB [Labilithrix sp.]|nr:chemotaxis-specific protein-glutamate methyltransferase CheB [Labilithrix sp.]
MTNPSGLIRVLVAEDSPTARALLVRMLSSSSGLEVIGEATNGIDAVEMTKRLKPDVVTMDIQMPGLDGFEATTRIMTECPTPIVIISSLDVKSVEFSMEALRAGALAVLPKPVGPTSADFGQVSRYLAATVRSMSQVKLVRRWPAAAPYKASPVALGPTAGPRPAAAPPLKAVAIAASTGGPAALHKLFAALPEDFPVPILFVQHIALGFAEGFATWLDGSSRLRVKVARAGEPLRKGTAYLAPDDQHLGISERSTVVLSSAPPLGSFRPSGSFLFESVASVLGAAAVGVILTGMGSDGVAGLRALKAAGGLVIAQDEATSEIFGMPGAAVAAGVTDLVLPLEGIALQLQRIAAARP